MPKRQNAEDGNKSVKLPLLFFACPSQKFRTSLMSRTYNKTVKFFSTKFQY